MLDLVQIMWLKYVTMVCYQKKFPNFSKLRIGHFSPNFHPSFESTLSLYLVEFVKMRKLQVIR